jgi:hypothetical protein
VLLLPLILLPDALIPQPSSLIVVSRNGGLLSRFFWWLIGSDEVREDSDDGTEGSSVLPTERDIEI